MRGNSYLRKRPMLFTTNKQLRDWGRVLHDDDLARAIVDRALERGRLITLDGPSQRTRHLEIDPFEYPEIQPARISGKRRPEFPEPAEEERTMNEKSLRKLIREALAKLDRLHDTRKSSRASSRWLRRVIAPAAIGVSLGLHGCGDSAGPRDVVGDDADAVAEADASPEADAAGETEVEPEADAVGETDAESEADTSPDTDVGPDASEDADAAADSEVATDSATDVAADEGGVPELCDDSRDNDGDGLCDCLDPDCEDSWDCSPVCPPGAPWFEADCANCHDGPDCDGLIDCDDPDCDSDPHCAG